VVVMSMVRSASDDDASMARARRTSSFTVRHHSWGQWRSSPAWMLLRSLVDQ
jgi:hypothetical protein